ncbi:MULTISPECIES: anti sigma factor C-terminal domain-containing protein [Bacillus]|uniref:anti sigma factor C-terminal domain-containing protein n=1 Tax=Bacillus TaxID=1386 RepID=UPI0002E8DE60|nr:MULTISPECIES: anti sigma factor C-terminal domain-containing protein [Bacillus]
MNNDEQDLDDLFSPKQTDLIKKAKSNSLKRMIITNILVTTITLLMLSVIKWQLTPFILNREMIKEQSINEIYGANTFVGPWDEEVKLLGSHATAPIFKFINGIPIQVKTIKNKYNQMEYFIERNLDKYRYNGQKLLRFAHPDVKYNKYSQEFSKLKDNSNAEIALSFDSSYSVSEVEEMLPDNVLVNWLWVNDYPSEVLDELSNEQQFLYENEVIGISMLANDGTSLENPYSLFYENLQIASKYRRADEELKTLKKKITTNGSLDTSKISIIGAVVSGKGSDLKKLEGLPFIKNASIGLTIQN